MSKSNKTKKNRRKDTPRGADLRMTGGLRPSKKLGQNFLVDEEVISEIIEGSSIDESSLVIEIGPGMGALTEHLVERAGRLVAIELDDRLIPVLRVKFFGFDNFELIHGDILEVDLEELVRREKEEYGLTNVRIVGNLPYYITTPIITKLLEKGTGADSITAMMQKEVGDRLAAEPGTKNAGAITYQVHMYSEVFKVVDAPSDCFYPAPKVDSVVLRMDLRDEPAVKVSDEEFFFRCIKAGFMQRRKTLLNSLMTLGDFSKAEISEALEKAGIETTRRAESLDMNEFAILADCLKETKNR